MNYKDNFSKQSQEYAKYRPDYPEELYTYLLSMTPGRSLAWDCATGNGQVALQLAKFFDHVIATDLSEKQLEKAHHATNINYYIADALNSGLPDSHADLITVAQAIHWFALPEFFEEVERIIKHGGLFSFWGYGLCQTDRPVQELLDHFYSKIVNPYWDPERTHIDNSYEKISDMITRPVNHKNFSIIKDWTAEDMLGYLGTWSAVQHYQEKEHKDPLLEISDEIYRLIDKRIIVKFPAFLKTIKY